MKKFKTSSVYLLLCSVAMGISACCTCGDPQLTRVQDVNALTLRFKVVTEIAHPDGTRTSSVSYVANASSVNVSTEDDVTTDVYLIATDSLSGVKCLELSGDFHAICKKQPDDTAITFHGSLPRPKQCLPLTACCLIQNEIALKDISQYLDCGPTRRTSGGNITVYGIAQSCAGFIDTVYVNFVPIPAPVITF